MKDGFAFIRGASSRFETGQKKDWHLSGTAVKRSIFFKKNKYHIYISIIADFRYRCLLPGASILCFLLPYLNDTRRPHIGNGLLLRYAKGLAQLRFYLPFLAQIRYHKSVIVGSQIRYQEYMPDIIWKNVPNNIRNV